MSLNLDFPQTYKISKKALERVKKEILTDTKDTLMILKAVSHPTRLRILRALNVKELCVCVFVELMRQRYSKLSYHLKFLREAKLVDYRKEKNFLIYRLTKLGKSVLKSLEG